MAHLAPPPFLLSSFATPAAWCDAYGAVVACNEPFTAWAGPVVGHRIEILGTRGALLAAGRPPRPLNMCPLVDGTWLALGAAGESQSVVNAVTAAVAQRLERLEASLEGNAQIGLLEGPSEPVARCLRETLAGAEELRVLRLQIAALGAPTSSERVPVCLGVLVRDAAAALRPLPVTIHATDSDFTVEVDRARLFPLLVGLLADLAGTATPEAPLHVELRGGDSVRVRLAPASLPAGDLGAIDAARRFVTAAGGRMLVEPHVAVVIEFPALASGLRAGASKGTVLIVDDDESSLAMMGAVLRRAGFDVLTAEDGVAASVLLRVHLSELVAIVADAVLPGRSGVELAAEARRSAPRLPVLLVSGHSSDLLGAADVDDLPILPKPFGARALTDRVRALLELD
jgi:CheY-like chemotaxis protein